jgi:hypothetical protein
MGIGGVNSGISSATTTPTATAFIPGSYTQLEHHIIDKLKKLVQST